MDLAGAGCCLILSDVDGALSDTLEWSMDYPPAPHLCDEPPIVKETPNFKPEEVGSFLLYACWNLIQFVFVIGSSDTKPKVR